MCTYPRAEFEEELNKMYRALEKEQWTVNKITITFSAGGITVTDHNVSIDQIVNFADECLYKAKENGKNQFIFYN